MQKGKSMSRIKYVYQEWMAAICADLPNSAAAKTGNPLTEKTIQIESAVRTALENLLPHEKEFIERYYFQGESYFQIAKAIKRDFHHMDGLHRQSVNQLRKLLAKFAVEKFGISIESSPNCPLCSSPFKMKIDIMIKNKKKSETWRKIISELKANYDIRIISPKILIVHQKYHT
jgi:hypothetical protein